MNNDDRIVSIIDRLDGIAEQLAGIADEIAELADPVRQSLLCLPCDTCGDAGEIHQEGQIGVPGNGRNVSYPDCQALAEASRGG